MTRDPDTWTREEWADLEADLTELEREEGIPDPSIAIQEHLRRQDILEAAWREFGAAMGRCGCTHLHTGHCPTPGCGCRHPHPPQTPGRTAPDAD